MAQAEEGRGERPVLVIGAAGLDLKGYATGALRLGATNPGQVRRSVGGVARNIAENLARLGQPVFLISAVADDEAGCWVLERTRGAGVEISHVAVVPQGRTGTYLAVLDEQGNLVVAVDDMGILETITPRYLQDRRSLFEQAAMVVLDANLSPAALRSAIRLARRCGVPVAADPTSPTLAMRLRPFLPELFLVTPNAAEAEALTGLPASNIDEALFAARYLTALGVQVAIITMAEMGLVYAAGDLSGHIPALRTEIVDFTGAGDALTAAVIFALLHEIPVEEAVRLGVAAAALTLRSRETVSPELSLERLYEQLVI
ncbi:MAG: ribokinase [Thermoflexus sp.]|uniref:carbohydrate kinase family protein n=1 Tax=Thermoflexus sp. TaxID=1969742 RepID=UPI00331D6415